jgi:hyperosmotically inducible periplasmic protein
MNDKLINITEPKRRSTMLVAAAVAAAMLAPLSASAFERDEDKTASERAKDVAESVRDTASDVRIHLAVETHLARSSELSALSIDTDVTDGVVRLKGEVETDTQKALAVELAKSVDGVKSVRNEIKVKSGEPSLADRIGQGATDTALTARVKTRLMTSRNTSGLGISVSTDERIVTLEGEVDSEAEKELAELIAANTSGVDRVRNRLAVANGY